MPEMASARVNNYTQYPDSSFDHPIEVVSVFQSSFTPPECKNIQGSTIRKQLNSELLWLFLFLIVSFLCPKWMISISNCLFVSFFLFLDIS